MRNRTRRRLGFVLMVLAVVLAALDLLKSSATMLLTGVAVAFLAVGALLLRNSRSSTEPTSESRRSSSR
jgi:Flp pilus assembly protein protease CpaA